MGLSCSCISWILQNTVNPFLLSESVHLIIQLICRLQRHLQVPSRIWYSHGVCWSCSFQQKVRLGRPTATCMHLFFVGLARDTPSPCTIEPEGGKIITNIIIAICTVSSCIICFCINTCGKVNLYVCWIAMCSSLKKQFVNLSTLVSHDGRYMMPGQSLKPPFTMHV